MNRSYSVLVTKPLSSTHRKVRKEVVICEITRLVNSWVDQMALRPIALKAMTKPCSYWVRNTPKKDPIQQNLDSRHNCPSVSCKIWRDELWIDATVRFEKQRWSRSLWSGRWWMAPNSYIQSFWGRRAIWLMLCIGLCKLKRRMWSCHSCITKDIWTRRDRSSDADWRL